MNQSNKLYFPSEFILDYIKDNAGKKRFFTYVIYRFLSAAGKKEESLAAFLKSKLSITIHSGDFSVIEDYLSYDYYFSPSMEKDTFDPLYLYDAIYMADDTKGSRLLILEELIASAYPQCTGLISAITRSVGLPLTNMGLNASYSGVADFGDDAFDDAFFNDDAFDDDTFDEAVFDEAAFYAALSLAVIHQESHLNLILPKLAACFSDDFHFTNDDFILFDFMDEYFEHKNCRIHPSFVELTDTLVAATLNYYHTDFGTLIEKEMTQYQNSTASRFAAMKRFGAVQLPGYINPDQACHMLAEFFRYAAIYELRNNLFDFHLEEDKLITLENWKEKLRWHYVQYANVYEMALDSFYAASLSRELLKMQFEKNLNDLSL